MNDRDLISIIERELENSLGYDSDSLDSERALALDYYLGRSRGDEKEGRSKVQSLDVADMIEAILAQILPSFTTNFSVSFGALSAEDEAQAKEESEYVNYVIQEANNGYSLFYTLFKDALLQKNCVAKVYPSVDVSVSSSEFHNIEESLVDFLIQPKNPNETVEVVSQNNYFDEETGLPSTDITFNRINVVKTIEVDPIPIEEFKINGDHSNISLEKCRFSCHERRVAQFELVELGIDPDLIELLPTDGGQDSKTSSYRRSQSDKENQWYETSKSTRPIRVQEIWLMVDYDEDGITERRHILRSGQYILINETVDYNIFGSGTPYIQPHKWLGLSIYDKLKQVQDIKVGLTRQLMDNSSHANNSRMGYVVNQVDEEDLHNSVPGGTIKMKRADALFPIQAPNVIGDIYSVLEYMDKVRTERAGAALDMQSQKLPVQPETAHGAERMATSKEQIVSMISKTLAETIVRDIYLITHRTIRDNISGLQYYTIDGQPKHANPSNWRERNRIRLNIGLSQGDRIRQATALTNVIEQQKVAMANQFDGVLVDVNGIYQAIIDYGRVSGIENPEKYWIDPASQQSQQAAKQKSQNAQMQQAKMEQQGQQMQQMQMQIINMQEETKRMSAMLKQQSDQKRLEEDRRQHGDDTAIAITELELEHDAALQGGVGEQESSR